MLTARGPLRRFLRGHAAPHLAIARSRRKAPEQLQAVWKFLPRVSRWAFLQRLVESRGGCGGDGLWLLGVTEAVSPLSRPYVPRRRSTFRPTFISAVSVAGGVRGVGGWIAGPKVRSGGSCRKAIARAAMIWPAAWRCSATASGSSKQLTPASAKVSSDTIRRLGRHGSRSASRSRSSRDGPSGLACRTAMASVLVWPSRAIRRSSSMAGSPSRSAAVEGRHLP